MESPYAKINNFCLVILAGVAITVILVYTRTILVPFVIALFIYALLTPLLKWMQMKLRIPRILAILVTAVLFIVIASIIFFLISASLNNFLQSAGAYQQRINSFINDVSQFLAQWNIQLNSEAIRNSIQNLPLLTVAQNITGSAVSLVGNTALVVIFVLFMIAGDGSQKRSHPLFDTIQTQISRYVATKSLLSVTTGVLIGIVLTIFSVDLAFMFAILTVLLNFIPNFGSVIATLLPIPVLLLQYGLGWQSITVLTLLFAIQFLIGNFIEPKMMGESLDLHPVAVLLFLMFWGLVWGLAGMFLAVPITAILKIILSRIETTRPLSELLAGRLPS